MRRAFQFRLSALLALTGVCAIAVWLFLPHSPHVVFLPPMMTFSSDSTGTGYPEVFVELQNKGRYAVWYHGCSGIISEFTIEGDLSKGQRHLHSLDPKHLDWVCLAPGETAMLSIPSDPSCSILRNYMLNCATGGINRQCARAKSSIFPQFR